MDPLSIRDEIETITKDLCIQYNDLHEIGKTQWESIKNKIEDKFLRKEYYTNDLHWGWEIFREPLFSLTFTDPAYTYFLRLIEDEIIWFVVEDYKNKMWLFEGKTQIIVKKVIPECLNLREYYLVSKKYEWILCENHHNIAYGSGEKVVKKMQRFLEENREEVIL